MLAQISMMNKPIIGICLILLSSAALAEGKVCIDQTGKKIFSDVTCEKRGLQVTKSDFSVASQDAVQPVFVVTNPDASSPDLNNTSNASAISTTSTTNKSQKRASPWSSDVPLKGIAWLLISLMPIAAVLFLGFHLVLFIKARLRKYRHVRSSMENHS